MITYRVWSRPTGKPTAKPKLVATHYRPEDAAQAALRVCMAGAWVRVTQSEGPDPSRWD